MDFSRLLRQGVLGEAIYVRDLQVAERLGSAKWKKRLAEIANEIADLRNHLATFIRENYKVTDRPDGR